MAADRIHVAETNPPHCSSCFGAKPSKPHIDFGAAWDGPVIGEGVTMHVIDDLIICEECIVRAARLIGMGFVEKVEDELRNAEGENDKLLEQVGNLRTYIRSLEEVRDERPTDILDPPKRQRRQKAAA